MRNDEARPDRTVRFSDMAGGSAPPILVLSTFHASVQRHEHDCYELVYVRDGFCLHEMEDRMALIAEGDLFLVKPGQRHRYLGNRVVSIYNCLFTPAQFQSCVNGAPYPFAGAKMHLQLAERNAASRLLAQMRDELDKRDALWTQKLASLLTCLLADCARMYEKRGSQGAGESAYPVHVATALDAIEAGYAEPLTVAAIAQAAGVSPDYLARQFAKALGVSPLSYLRRYRAARAMELLSSGKSVAETASRVGYLNPSHFSREFKKEAGVTPTQYRRQN